LRKTFTLRDPRRDNNGAKGPDFTNFQGETYRWREIFPLGKTHNITTLTTMTIIIVLLLEGGVVEGSPVVVVSI